MRVSKTNCCLEKPKKLLIIAIWQNVVEHSLLPIFRSHGPRIVQSATHCSGTDSSHRYCFHTSIFEVSLFHCYGELTFSEFDMKSGTSSWRNFVAYKPCNKYFSETSFEPRRSSEVFTFRDLEIFSSNKSSVDAQLNDILQLVTHSGFVSGQGFFMARCVVSATLRRLEGTLMETYVGPNLLWCFCLVF